jgi:hypothetical protein
MSDWLHNLPIVWMALLVFGLTALGTAAIYVVVTAQQKGAIRSSRRPVIALSLELQDPAPWQSSC